MEPNTIPKGITLTRKTDYIHVYRGHFEIMGKLFYTMFYMIVGYLLIDKVIVFWREFDLFWLHVVLAFVSLAALALLAYLLAATWLNQMHFFASEHTLEVVFKPLSLFGCKRTAVADIRQLYVTHKPGSHCGGAPNTKLFAHLKNGSHRKLLSGIYPHQHGVFIADTLNEYWGKNSSIITHEHPWMV